MIKWRSIRVGIFSFLGALLLSLTLAAPSQAHWADLAVADIGVSDTTAQMTLTFPTGLIASADDDRDGQLSAAEIQTHQGELRQFLGDRIRLTDQQGNQGVLIVKPSDTTALPSNLKVTVGTHSSLQLVYSWAQPVQGVKVHYNLFLPGVQTARCLATVTYRGHTQSVIFSPENRELSLMQNPPWYLAGGVPLAIAGCFIWGAMHAMSPGHGKTIVGAYLVGSHATPQHALFLGLTTTITHTAGVFALGLATLLFSFILPERLYPWLSFISGLIVVDIGLRLLISRLRQSRLSGTSGQHQVHDHSSSQTHDHSPNHSHSYAPDPTHDRHSEQAHHTHHGDPTHSEPDSGNHGRDGHTHGKHVHAHTHSQTHSHLPPGADGKPVTWRNLLALGISGGMVPCPSALVVLLSTIALGQAGFGLLLVLAFSLGLAGTLTGLGLLLVSTRRLFERIPTQLRMVKALPALSALSITLLGLGISTQAVMQLGLLKL